VRITRMMSIRASSTVRPVRRHSGRHRNVPTANRVPLPSSANTGTGGAGRVKRQLMHEKGHERGLLAHALGLCWRFPQQAGCGPQHGDGDVVVRQTRGIGCFVETCRTDACRFQRGASPAAVPIHKARGVILQEPTAIGSLGRTPGRVSLSESNGCAPQAASTLASPASVP